MAEEHTPPQFVNAAKKSLKEHQQDLLERQEAAADASHDLEARQQYRAMQVREIKRKPKR